MSTQIRIGTRGSELALWQSNHIASQLVSICPNLEIEIVAIKTEGDKRLDVPLSKVGGKGLFIKELENALIDNRIDIAVHSMKDVTVYLAEDFCVPVILERGDPYDAFVSNKYASLSELPNGAVVGTCSLRRHSQLLNTRPDLKIKSLRGNVNTRLKRLDNGEYDGIILAAAGLKRLGLGHRIAETLNNGKHIPSPGQGALGIECRSDDPAVLTAIMPLNHEKTNVAVNSERAVNAELGGSCYVPIGVHAHTYDKRLDIQAFIGSVDGQQIVEAQVTAALDESANLPTDLAQTLIKNGAMEILETCSPSSTTL